MNLFVLKIETKNLISLNQHLIRLTFPKLHVNKILPDL